MRMKNKEYGLLRKSGDAGFSDLFSGEKISKASLRLDAIGELDELGCVIGIAKLYVNSKFHSEFLQIQRTLFVIGSEIATLGKLSGKLPGKIDSLQLKWLESLIEKFLKTTKLPKGFILSGSTPSSSYLHLARAVTRRCERRLVLLYQKKQIKNKNILAFMNRLSVYFFVLSVWHDKSPILVKK